MDEIQKKNFNTNRMNMKNKEIARRWRTEVSADVKQKYFTKARLLKEEHQRKYPGWKEK